MRKTPIKEVGTPSAKDLSSDPEDNEDQSNNEEQELSDGSLYGKDPENIPFDTAVFVSFVPKQMCALDRRPEDQGCLQKAYCELSATLQIETNSSQPLPTCLLLPCHPSREGTAS